MNKTQLVDAIAAEAGLSKGESTRAVDSFVKAITGVLQSGGEVTLAGFGTFKVGSRAERMGRNPKTGEAIVIAASTTPQFRPGKGLKDAVSGK